MELSAEFGINVDFWADRYPPDYLHRYRQGIDRPPEDALSRLWDWKGLRRKHEPEEVHRHLDYASECVSSVTSVDDAVRAIESFRERLKDDGVISVNSTSVVLPQFVLHVVDGHRRYSRTFPILDIMVARTHQIVTGEQRTLLNGLTYSEQRYRKLVEYIWEYSDGPTEAARLERAMFVYGRFVTNTAPESLDAAEAKDIRVTEARKYMENVDIANAYSD